MPPFIGRHKELEVLNKAYTSPQSEFFPIYGRRRVGKSELILHFIKGKPSLYFLGKKGPPPMQIKEFLEESARTFKQPLLASAQVENWKKALQLVVGQKKTAKKWILVLDEFQWIAQASPELPSILQELFDQEWRKRKDIFLILCGSYFGFMEKEVLGEKSPLFGRRTGQILLKPFSYLEAAQFHPSWSLQDKAKVYFICGGVPFYHLFFKEGMSLNKNIEKNLLAEFAPLFREPDFLLREELRELQKYYGILMCLASGANTSAQIAAQTGIEERKLYYYIQTLVECGYVRRHFPLTPKKKTGKEVLYILADALLRFWFRFIYPHTAYISQVSTAEAFRNIVKPSLESYFGSCFEHLCREALPYLYQREGVHVPFEAGQYWDKQIQIDVAGIRKKEGIDLGECKWGKIKSFKNEVTLLQEKMQKYPNPQGLTVTGRFFLQETLSIPSLPPNLRIYSLKDLYSLSIF